MSLNLSKFYAFFAFFILIFAGCADESRSTFFNGYVEGDYLYVAPSVSGRIVNLSVKEGAVVQKGEPLTRSTAWSRWGRRPGGVAGSSRPSNPWGEGRESCSPA